MKKLDEKDLERFSWENMSPMIDQKVKEKKKKLYFFSFMKLGGIALFFLLCFWSIDLNTKSDSVAANLTSKNNIQTNEIIDQNLDTQDRVPTRIISNHTVIPEKLGKGYSINVEQNEELNQEFGSVYDLENQLTEKATNVGQTRASSTSLEKENKTGFIHFSNEQVKIEPETRFETPFIASLDLKEVESMELFEVQRDSIVEKKEEIEKPFRSIALSFGTNSLAKHPYTSVLGIGGSLGYWVSFRKSHYVGFEYSFQRYKYEFEYPAGLVSVTGEAVSVNSHDIYSFPVYYGYKLSGDTTTVSLEAGINVNMLKFSKGAISSRLNESAIINIEGDNYFRKNISASLLLRAKIDFLLKRNYGIFARVGTNVSFRNWYKNDSYTIKPILLNIDVGVRRSF